MVTKDLPISPRFTPYKFLSRCKFSTLTTRQPMVEFYSLSHAFRYERKNTNPTLVRIELTTSALAGVQLLKSDIQYTHHPRHQIPPGVDWFKIKHATKKRRRSMKSTEPSVGPDLLFSVHQTIQNLVPELAHRGFPRHCPRHCPRHRARQTRKYN